jgi:hypothetical protein
LAPADATSTNSLYPVSRSIGAEDAPIKIRTRQNLPHETRRIKPTGQQPSLTPAALDGVPPGFRGRQRRRDAEKGLPIIESLAL